MIPEFVQAWDANKDKLKAAFIGGEEEFGSYQALVKALLVYVVNPYLKEIGKDTYNTERIHEIDDGEYQGSLLYVIPKNHYQPLFSDYLLTYAEYGSCPLCDLLEGICESYDKEHPEETADSLMSLCLHLLQRCKIPYAFDEYVSDSDWEVREMTDEEYEQLKKDAEGKPSGKVGSIVFRQPSHGIVTAADIKPMTKAEREKMKKQMKETARKMFEGFNKK